MIDFYGRTIKEGDIIIFRSSSQTTGKMELREVGLMGTKIAQIRKINGESNWRSAYIGPETAILYDESLIVKQ